jgi:hypothetical protein
MNLFVGILAFMVLTIVLTTILDLLNNKESVSSYQLATTFLNFAISFVASLSLFLFLGFKHTGAVILAYFGFVV